VDAVLASSALRRHAAIVESRDIVITSAYDFMIAGGGIAGLTVASRMTEDLDGEQAYRVAKCSPAQTHL
jgi:hypothetical protein